MVLLGLCLRFYSSPYGLCCVVSGVVLYVCLLILLCFFFKYRRADGFCGCDGGFFVSTRRRGPLGCGGGGGRGGAVGVWGMSGVGGWGGAGGQLRWGAVGGELG